jgi:hypothetical protein
MVLRLKARESRSLPGLPNALCALLLSKSFLSRLCQIRPSFACQYCGRASTFDAGWSSPVARQAHNLKVVGSNPAPAPKFLDVNGLAFAGLFLF